ncbi:hypothetical protein [Corallococcus sp. CA054B]|uniref:hypothetical protein n=1 Tax=Corallococcus sp. CA054B TaxID=2316734 RepID=UPI0018F3A47E|nr:hypothetical protein [Corallococcus sp. CA054B]
MNPFTMVHLALSGAFTMLALVHFATWVAVRSQRVQLWLAYMPPERMEGAEATPSGDLFALGCVLFELLTGNLARVIPPAPGQVKSVERADALEASRVLRGGAGAGAPGVASGGPGRLAAFAVPRALGP